MENEKTKISLPWLNPAKRTCGAKTRSGQPCRKWAMKNGKCRTHGGASTGATTPEGKIKSRMANFKNGKYAVAKQKERTIRRVLRFFPASESERITLKINAMSFVEFQKLRSRLQSYIIKEKMRHTDFFGDTFKKK